MMLQLSFLSFAFLIHSTFGSWESEFRDTSMIMLTSPKTGNTFLYSLNSDSLHAELIFTTNCPAENAYDSNETLWMDYSVKHNSYILACRKTGYVTLKTFPIDPQ